MSNKESLTPQLLKEEYRKLNQLYFGPSTFIDQEIDIEWARIPHFYYNFYVYQYATGISAALALADKVVNGTEKRSRSLSHFLKRRLKPISHRHVENGRNRYDFSRSVKAAIQTFDTLLNRLNNTSS